MAEEIEEKLKQAAEEGQPVVAVEVEETQALNPDGQAPTSELATQPVVDVGNEDGDSDAATSDVEPSQVASDASTPKINESEAAKDTLISEENAAAELDAVAELDVVAELDTVAELDAVELDEATEQPKAELDQAEALVDSKVEPPEVTPREKADVSHPLAQDIVLNPTGWLIWPAVAVLRWLLKRAAKDARRIIYRSEPSLNFPPSEINDIAVDADGIELILNSPGLAAAGSALPSADVERVIKDKRKGGALADFLDGTGDRFMHALETSQTRNNAAFSLAVGGRIESLVLAANLVGRSAPLTAFSGGELSADRRSAPEGAVGLASMYMGPISATRMEDLFHAVTRLPVRVREFTGAEIPVLKPARVGGRIGAMLGRRCIQPEAGVEVIINGGSDVEAVEWAASSARRRSLHLLANSFVGSPCPSVSLFLLLSANNVPSATLDDQATLGVLSVLGEAQLPTFIPLL